MIRRQLAFLLAVLLLCGPLTPRRARADEEPENLSFAELAQPLASASHQQAREGALKARQIPVDNRGAFTTSIPIDVPPGRRGMTPRLALQYNSGSFRRESPFGVGFSLDVGSIRRSTASGYPKLDRVAGSLRYVDSPIVVEEADHTQRVVGTFEGPSGRLAELDCAQLPEQCPPEALPTSRVYAPEVEQDPVRYEYQPAAPNGGAWIEYLPDGVRRFYGRRPTTARVQRDSRVRNSFGTFAWMLVYEVDRFGNDIVYDYRGSQWDQARPTVPQDAPVLTHVEWGDNEVAALGLPMPFFVTIDLTPERAPLGGVDFMNGGVRHAWHAFAIRVGDATSTSSSSLYWDYALIFDISPFTSATRLTSVVREAPGESANTSRVWSFSYSGAPPSWQAQPSVLPGDIYAEHVCTGSSPCQDFNKGYPTLSQALAPPGMRSPFHFFDFDGDGALDVIYHPAHLRAPSAPILPGSSYIRNESGAFTHPQLGGYFPPDILTNPSLSDLVDVDGDGDVDGVSWGGFLEEAARGNEIAPGIVDVSDICGDDNFWNRCGFVDIYDPFYTPESELDLAIDDGIPRQDPPPGIPPNQQPPSCVQLVSACVNGQAGQGTISFPGLPSETDQQHTTNFVPQIVRNLTKPSSQGFRDFVLADWPQEVHAAASHENAKFGARPAVVARTTADFYAPLVDVNGDGLADVVLLKYMYIIAPSAKIQTAKFFPRVWLANNNTVEKDPDHSAFETTLKAAFLPALTTGGRERTYSELTNSTAMLLDLNVDGLPDVIRATPPAITGPSAIRCDNGHDVWLNRGTGWSNADLGFQQTWSGAGSGLDFLINRTGKCARKNFTALDVPPGARLPPSALAIADVNADGRPDLLFAGRNADNLHPTACTTAAESLPTCRYFQNTPTGFVLKSLPSFPVDVHFALGLPDIRALGPDANQQADRGRLVDIDLDGLVDIVKPGTSTTDPQSGRERVIQPASFLKNMGQVPDLMATMSTEGGASTTVSYVAATSFSAGARQGDGTVEALGDAPAGLMLVRATDERAAPSDPAEHIAFKYRSFVRDALTREPVGWSEITSTHSPGVVAGSQPGAPVKVRRVFDTTSSIAGSDVRYPFRGFIREVDVDDGTTLTREKTRHDAVQLGGALRVRVGESRFEECQGAIAACAVVTDSVAEREPDFGYPTVSSTTDSLDDSDVVTATRTYEHQRASWNLGLLRGEVTTGRTERLDGSVIASELTSTSSTYFANGLVKTDRRETGSDPNCPAQPPDATSYQYDALGLRKNAERPNRFISVIYDRVHLYPASTTIDAAHAASLTETTEYDLRHGLVIHRIDANAGEWTTTFDSHARTTLAVGPRGTILSSSTYADVDVAGRPFSTTRIYSANTAFSESKVTRDGLGRQIAVVDGEPTTGFLRRSRLDLDGFGRAVFRYQPREVADLDTIVAPGDGALDRFTMRYDGFDRLTFSSTPDGRVTTTEYAPRLVKTTYPRGNGLTRQLDGRGDTITAEAFDVDEHELALTAYARDGLGRVVRVTDADNDLRRMAFDLGGRLATTTLPSADGLAGSATSCWNADDALVGRRTAGGRSVAIVVDGLARSLSVTATAPGARDRAIQFTYDDAASHGLGRVRSREDETGRREFTYDDMGRRRTAKYAASAEAIASFDASVSYSYDNAGRLDAAELSGDAAPVTLRFERDGLGRIRDVVDQDARFVASLIGYDAYDRATSVDFAASRMEWTYDEQSEVLSNVSAFGASAPASGAGVVAPAAPALPPASNGNNDEQSEGESEQDAQHGQGDHSELEAGLDRNWENVDDEEAQPDPGFDTLSPLAPAPPAVSAPAAPGAAFFSVDYLYDDNLNVLVEAREGPNRGAKNHVYDGLDRLTQTTLQLPPSGARTESYTYTPAGKIDVAAGRKYLYGSGDISSEAVVELRDARDGGEARILAYDRDGFGTRDNDNRLVYDGLGCLSHAASTALTVDRICDDDGHELLRTTQDAGSTSRVVDLFGIAEIRPDSGRMVLRIAVNGTAIAEETYALGSTGARIADESRAIHTDVRGSVLLTSINDAAPTIDQDIEYDSWGATIAGANLPTHRFVDHEEDVLGYYVFGKRVYAPTLRRWLSADPLTLPGGGGDPRQLDLYAYAANNPVRWTDTNGRIVPILVVGAIGLAIGITTWNSDDPGPSGDMGADLRAPIGVAITLMGPWAAAEATLAGGSMVLAGIEGSTVAGSAGLVPVAAGVAVGTVGASLADPRDRPVQNQMATREEGGGGKTGRKVAKDARETGQGKLNDAREKLKAAIAKPNKTREDKELIKKLEGQVKKAQDNLKPSEEHAKKQQGPSR